MEFTTHQKEAMQVVIVEDSAADALLMKKAVIEVGGPGTEVLVFESGESAVEYLNGLSRSDGPRDGIPDLFLVDLSLPEMSGFQFLEWLREQKAFVDTPVAVISAFQNLDAELARTLDAAAYFKKPEDVGKYVRMLQKAVDARSDGADE